MIVRRYRDIVDIDTEIDIDIDIDIDKAKGIHYCILC